MAPGKNQKRIFDLKIIPDLIACLDWPYDQIIKNFRDVVQNLVNVQVTGACGGQESRNKGFKNRRSLPSSYLDRMSSSWRRLGKSFAKNS